MKRRWSTTAGACVALAAPVVLLAVLQWRWLDEIEEHEYYRRDRRVGYATWVLKMIFDHEVESLARALTAPVASRSNTGSELAARRERWRSSARWPDLLADVYVVEPGRGSKEPALARLDPEAAALRPIAWPPALLAHAPALADSVARWPLDPAADFRVLPSLPALIVPSPSLEGPSALFLVLDREVLIGRLFPELVRILFPPPSFQSIEVAVAEAESGRVLFSSLGIERSSDFGRADVIFNLVPQGAGPGELPRPLAENPVVPSRQWQPTAADEEWFRAFWSRNFYSGHWQILVRGGDLPIAEEVAAMRARRAAAAFGLLALLATGVALLAVVARRSQRAARDQLEQLARVSHELRTPLAVLTSAGDNLADGLASEAEKVKRYGQVIRKEARRLAEMVENVLHLSRRRAATPRVEPQWVDVVELIEDSIGLAEPSLREAGFTVERSLPSHAVQILGEPRALRSAVLNLISNAIKYGRAGRWLRLAVEEDAGAEVRIVVEDRGPGIAARDLPRLFLPYARGERAMLEQTEGSGLGLAVVKDVVEAHAGRIAVASPAGGGAAFTLHLPLAPAR